VALHLCDKCVPPQQARARPAANWRGNSRSERIGSSSARLGSPPSRTCAAAPPLAVRREEEVTAVRLC
jgi:hypothetical protein